MSGTSRNNRRSKREMVVLNDNESNNGEPAEKTVKKEAESAPSAELQQKLTEAEQKLAKSEDQVQRRLRTAANDKAKNQVPAVTEDAKKVKELEKKVASIEANAAAAEKKAEESAARAAELERELKKKREERSEEREKGEEKVSELSNKLMMERRRADDQERDRDRKETNNVVKFLKNGPNMQMKRYALECLRRLLGGRNTYDVIDKVIYSGLIHKLVQGLSIDDAKFKHDCVWILDNISSNGHFSNAAMSEVADAGAIVPLIKLMIHANYELAEIATSMVANIVGISPGQHDVAIQSNGVDVLMHLIGKMKELPSSFQLALARVFDNMCSLKDPQVLQVLVPGLLRLMQSEECDVRRVACWAVSHLAAGPDDQKSLFRDSGIMPHIYKLLLEDTDRMVAPALCVFVDMTAGNESQKQSVINLGTLRVLPEVARKTKSAYILNECCVIITNVLSGTEQQRQAVIDNELLPMLVAIMKMDGYQGYQRVCSSALVKVTKGGTTAQILSLVNEKPFPSLAVILTHTCAEFTDELEMIYKLLKTVVKARPNELDAVKKEMEESGVMGHLKNMQKDNYKKPTYLGSAESWASKERNLARKIISEFFA